MKLKRGFMINLEGVEAAGKTLLLKKIANFFEGQDIPFIRTKEPGGTKLAEQVRMVLLDPANVDMHMNTEIIGYAFARSSHVHNMLLPSLAEGKVILCDRYIDSSIAYQGYGAGHTKEQIEEIKRINRFASSNLVPDRTYLIDIPVEESFKRMGIRAEEMETELDRIEQRARDFHHRVHKGFHEIAKENPERVMVVDGMQTPDDVFATVVEDLQQFIKKFTF